MLKLSIITINYNDKTGLQKTIESVVKQRTDEIQYIVIDGGSTDGSLEIIKENEKDIDYWLSESDEGVYQAMNKGISISIGEYIYFLNSGDWLVKDTLFKVFERSFLSAPVVYGNVMKVFDTSNIVRDKGFEGKKISLWDMFSSNIHHQSCFIKKELFDIYGKYNEEYKIVSDWAFFLKVVGIKGVETQYHDLDISYFDMLGISSTNISLRQKERELELSNQLPENLYSDYVLLRDVLPESKIFRRLKKNRILWSVIRLYNKIFINSLW